MWLTVPPTPPQGLVACASCHLCTAPAGKATEAGRKARLPLPASTYQGKATGKSTKGSGLPMRARKTGKRQRSYHAPEICLNPRRKRETGHVTCAKTMLPALTPWMVPKMCQADMGCPAWPHLIPVWDLTHRSFHRARAGDWASPNSATCSLGNPATSQSLCTGCSPTNNRPAQGSARMRRKQAWEPTAPESTLPNSTQQVPQQRRGPGGLEHLTLPESKKELRQ